MIEAREVAVVLFALPLAGGVFAFARPRAGRAVALGTALALVAAAVIGVALVAARGPFEERVGGWVAPLGIRWRMDGASALMLLLAAGVGAAATLARSAQAGRDANPEGRLYGALWLFLSAGLSGIFLSADAFNLYVALEIAALASVGLIALSRGSAWVAAWRYFLATLIGSTLYLLGVAVLYGQYGALDLDLLGELIGGEPAARLGAALITAGLALKAAVAPLHFWLPAAHGLATPPVSALLSGVVVAAAAYLLLEFWLGPFFGLLPGPAGWALGALGALGVLWGGAQALAQRELKMIFAYSTVSQLGFAVLALPIAAAGALDLARGGAVILLLAHGFAKGALFLAAGAVAAGAGGARLPDRGRVPVSGLSWLALALASASLIGIPPTGGFVGKFWLLEGAAAAGAWPWFVAILAGTLLTGAYLFRVLGALSPTLPAAAAAPGRGGGLAGAALSLALAAWALAWASPWLEDLLVSAGSHS